MSKVVIMAMTVFLLGFYGTPKAEAGMMHHCHGHMRMIMHGAPIPFYLMNQDRLGLTKDQVHKLVHLRMAFRKTAIMEKARIKVIKEDVKADMMKKSIDTADVKKDINRIVDHKKKIMDSYVEMVSNAHKVLTEEQFQKVRTLWREMMMMHHGMMMHHDMMDHHKM